MAGYSGTPLAKKLGIKDGMTIAARDAPADFEQLLAPLPDDVVWRRQLRAPIDLVVSFFTRRADIGRSWERLAGAVGDHGTIWVAWPKRASGVPTDCTEDVFREEVLPTGWVDVKVCAIDDTWSGLKFVKRVELRAR